MALWKYCLQKSTEIYPRTRHQSKPIVSCGDGGGTTQKGYVEILEFKHFVEFFSFNKIGENHKEKIPVQRVTVVVALDLGTGNTKNLEYENEQRAIRSLIDYRDTC